MQRLQTALDVSVNSTSQREGHLAKGDKEKEGDHSRQDAVTKDEESTVLSLNERPNGANYGSTDHRDPHINSS